MSDAQFTAEEQEWVDAFLAETTLFLGPDPEIMNDHRMAPRTAEEDRLLSGPVDANDLDRVRKRIVAGLDEAFEMMEQTGAAPGAKWGDLTSAVYSASGDLSTSAPAGCSPSPPCCTTRSGSSTSTGSATRPSACATATRSSTTTPATATSTTPTRA
jgi:hypothetical protein